MIILVGILASIITFGIIILAHEFGHFKAARIFGVKVEEFGFGIPPRAKKLFKDEYGTIYTLNWLPLGGFVKLKGENINTFSLYDKKKRLFNNESLEKAIENNEDIFDSKGNKLSDAEKKEILEKLKENFSPDSLLSKSYWKQAIIILAGVFMNFALAWIIFSFLFFIGVSPIGINDKIKTNVDLKLIPTPEKALEIGLIKENTGVYLLPTPGSIASKSGIKNYDLVLKANDLTINSYKELKNIISKNPGNEVVLEIERALNNCDVSKQKECRFENIKIKVTPDTSGKIGAYLVPNTEINKDLKYRYGFLESIKFGFVETYGQIVLTFKGIQILVKKVFNPETPKERSEAIAQVSGPIGVADFMTKSIGNGMIFIMLIGAIISINLGVFNLLPIPALDGGRFLFVVVNSVIKKIFGKKAISDSLEGMIHVGFFIFLIALSLIIAYNDINRIINN